MASDEGTESVQAAPGKTVIGIAFGNSTSSIAYVGSEGKAVVIANEDGDRQIPSTLSFVEGEEHHGALAKAQLVRNAKNTVTHFRDYLGKPFAAIDRSRSDVSAKPQEHNASIAYQLQTTPEDKLDLLTIDELATRHLRRLVGSASDFLGQKIDAAVIAVPTDFEDDQIKALEKAAHGAGVQVLQFIEEPLADLLAYDGRPGVEAQDKTVVVADFGGLRSDVAVVSSRQGLYSIISTQHSTKSSGQHLDQTLIDHFAKEFVKKFKKGDPRDNPRSLAKLRLETESTKKALSLGTNASISIEGLLDGIDYSANINRTRYDVLASKVVAGMTQLIQKAIETAELDILDIDEIILAGGASHTPKIASSLASIFPSTTVILAPSTSASALNPAELTARGAAIQASIISDYDTSDVQKALAESRQAVLHLQHAIGVLVPSPDHHDRFQPILLPHTAAPARRSFTLPASANGDKVQIRVCEGHSHIKVTAPAPKAKADKAKREPTNDDEDDDSSDEDSEEEEEEIREKIWKVGTLLAELEVPGASKGKAVDITISIGPDLQATVEAKAQGAAEGAQVKLDPPSGDVHINGAA